MRDGTRRTLQGTLDRTRELGREELGSTVLDTYLPVSRVLAEGNQRESRGLPFRVILNFVPNDIGKVPGGGDVALDNLPDRDCPRFVGDIAPDKGGGKSLLQPSLAAAPPGVHIGRQCFRLENLPRGVLPSEWNHDRSGGLAPEPRGRRSIRRTGLVSHGGDRGDGRWAPAIGTRKGDISDQIDAGQTAILVSQSDAAALAHPLQRILGSPELRR